MTARRIRSAVIILACLGMIAWLAHEIAALALGPY